MTTLRREAKGHFRWAPWPVPRRTPIPLRSEPANAQDTPARSPRLRRPPPRRTGRARRSPTSSSSRSTPAAAIPARATRTTSSSCSTAAPPPSPGRLDRSSTRPPPGRAGRRPRSRDRSPARHFLVQLTRGGHRRRAAGPRRDRHHQPRRLRRQGRGRDERDRTRLRRLRRQLLGGSGVEDLVGYGSATDYEGADAAPALSSSTAAVRAGSRLHRHRLERRRLHGGRALAAKHLVARGHLQRRRAPPGGVSSRRASTSTSRTACRSRSSSPTISFGTALVGHDAGVGLGAGHGQQQQRGRLLADRPPHRVHARRPAARHREHGPGRRHARAPALVGGRAQRSRSRRRPTSLVGTTSARSAGARGRLADDARIHRSAPVVAPGRYSATVTYTLIGR